MLRDDYSIIKERGQEVRKQMNSSQPQKNLKNLNVRDKNFNKNKKYKLTKKILGKVATVVLVATMGIVGVHAFNAYKAEVDKETQQIAISYVIEQNEANDAEFYTMLEHYGLQAAKINDYVDISEKLNDLNLDKYNLSDLEFEVEFYTPEQVNDLISEYNSLKDTDGNIGNDVIKLNNIVYILQVQEKLYNEKLYNSYEVLEKYSLSLAKSFIAGERGISDPSTIKLRYKFDKTDGKRFVWVDFGLSESRLNTDDKINDKISYLVKYSTDMDSQVETDINKIQAYNGDRNELLKNTLNDINLKTAWIIKLYNEENEKGNQK